MLNTLFYSFNSPRHITRWFYLFIFIHFFCWAGVPFLVRYNLPLDAIEGAIWGHQLEWGYDKNPFLNGWLTALASYWDGYSSWMIYGFSQISVILAFWAIWQIAKNILPTTYALLAILLLESVQYYNLHAIDFNDNTLELGLWGLLTYSFYVAVSSRKAWAWLWTGFFAGLGLMTKYYTGVLLLAMLLFFLRHSFTRQQFKTWPPYLGLCVFLMIVTPHVLWLTTHDYITVTYVFARTHNTPQWSNHIFYPAQFFWQQLEVFIPALVLFAVLFIGSKPRKAQDITISSFNKSFLIYMGLGPLLITMTLSLLFGITLRAGWGMPLQSLWGVMLFALIQPRITRQKLLGFMTLIYILMGILLISYANSLINSPDESSANFMGQKLAQQLTQTWQKRYHTKLAYVAGSRWLSGNVAFYSTDHPSVWMEWNHKHAPWIDMQDLQQKGAIFIWDITAHEQLPQQIATQFPTLQKDNVMKLTWHRNKYHLAPVEIGIAWLPPKG